MCEVLNEIPVILFNMLLTFIIADFADQFVVFLWSWSLDVLIKNDVFVCIIMGKGGEHII